MRRQKRSWTPTQESIEHDPHSASQRNHGGLLAALRGLLASGELGQHNGLPASIVVTTTLQELEAAAGRGLTGGGTILPISDVIRLARHAHHYLAVFHHGKALALYRTKRLAPPAQRIILHANKGTDYALLDGCPVGRFESCRGHHLTSADATPRKIRATKSGN